MLVEVVVVVLWCLDDWPCRERKLQQRMAVFCSLEAIFGREAEVTFCGEAGWTGLVVSRWQRAASAANGEASKGANIMAWKAVHRERPMQGSKNNICEGQRDRERWTSR